jgi:hypothetical protein
MTEEPNQKTRFRGPIHRAAHVAAKPINLLVEKIHTETCKHKHITRGTVCLIVVFAGAFMATHIPTVIPHELHFVWDGVAYSIHGIGAAPIAERIIAFFVVAAEE